ncbi:hypothetical protein SESBI_13408 [Sesbania bispinosa]|nr:hypothetical protein SESBI_13408 [Sesbania bispinosa]
MEALACVLRSSELSLICNHLSSPSTTSPTTLRFAGKRASPPSSAAAKTASVRRLRCDNQGEHDHSDQDFASSPSPTKPYWFEGFEGYARA